MTTKPMDLSTAESALGVKLIANGIGTQALHETVVAYAANRRAGTHSAKTKATVNLSGAKPWRQKGTGNARAGYKASPVWTGGGAAHGPKPRDYSKITPKKVKRLALKKAVSEAAKSGKLSSVSTFELKEPKTKELATWIVTSGLPDSLLIITKEKNDKALKASRNIPRVDVIDARQVNAEHILRYKAVVVAEDALPSLAERLK